MECKALVVVQGGCSQDKCCLNLLEVMNATGALSFDQKTKVCRGGFDSLLRQIFSQWVGIGQALAIFLLG